MKDFCFYNYLKYHICNFGKPYYRPLKKNKFKKKTIDINSHSLDNRP